MRQLRVTEIVSVASLRHPGRWEILKVNEKTCRVRRLADGKVMRVAQSMLIDPVPDGQSHTAAVLESVRRPAGLRIGAVCYLTIPAPGLPGDRWWVVITDYYDRVKIVPLGGDDDSRSWTVTVSRVRVVSPEEILR